MRRICEKIQPNYESNSRDGHEDNRRFPEPEFDDRWSITFLRVADMCDHNLNKVRIRYDI